MRAGTYYFRESMDILMRARWVGPYLLIPPMLAFMVYAEGYLSAHGFTGNFSMEQRTVLALWNATLLLTLASGVKACLFFSNLWGSRWFRNSLALPVSRSSGYWGPVLAVLAVSIGMYFLATVAVAAALPEVGSFPWVRVLAGSCAPVAWAVCVGALLGLLTSGPAASVLFSSVMLLGFLAGLPIETLLPGWALWIVPPVGRIMTDSLSMAADMENTGLLLIHSTVALAAGRLLYGYGYGRR
jgi:hypothetical protein